MPDVRFERIRVINAETDAVIVDKSIDGPTGLKFCVDAPERVPAPERGPGLTRAPKLRWLIRVKKLEPPYEGPAILVFDMTKPALGILIRTPSKFHISPYIDFISFGPREYEVGGYARYPDYEGYVDWRLTVERGGAAFEHGEVLDGYILTLDPETFISKHEDETIYFPNYYCEIIRFMERHPRIANLINRAKQRVG